MKPSFIGSMDQRYGSSYLSEFSGLITRFAPNAHSFLEWGSGSTTAALCALAESRQDPFVLSIDHVLDYSLAISRDLDQYPFLHLRVIDLQGPSFDQCDQETNYSSYPFFLGQRFDVVFVDGRRRVECALVAAQVVKPDGIVLVHDYRRLRYKPMLAVYDVLHEEEQFLVLRSKIAPPLAHNTPPKERRLIAVPVHGASAEQEFLITKPFFEAYARKTQADLITFGLAEGQDIERLKSNVRTAAQGYDRVLLMDADILIRPESPDLFCIVPPETLGAFVEGSQFAREDYVAVVNEAYHLSPPLEARQYFNTGVMLISSQHLSIFERLAEDILYCHPQFEQGLLNAEVYRNGIPLHPLPIDFNFIPTSPYMARDFAYSFFYHPAGALPHDPRHVHIWRDVNGRRNLFKQAVYLPSRRRHLFLRALSDRINGVESCYFDLSDLQYYADRVGPMLSHNGAMLARFPPLTAVPGDGLAIFGPYCPMRAGTWTIDFITENGSPLIYGGASLDVVSGGGTVVHLEKTVWPNDGCFTFRLEQDVNACEFRIYRAEQSAEFLYIRARKTTTDVETPDYSVS